VFVLREKTVVGGDSKKLRGSLRALCDKQGAIKEGQRLVKGPTFVAAPLPVSTLKYSQVSYLGMI
jgi:hypothetical protein